MLQLPSKDTAAFHLQEVFIPDGHAVAEDILGACGIIAQHREIRQSHRDGVQRGWSLLVVFPRELNEQQAENLRRQQEQQQRIMIAPPGMSFGAD